MPDTMTTSYKSFAEVGLDEVVDRVHAERITVDALQTLSNKVASMYTLLDSIKKDISAMATQI